MRTLTDRVRGEYLEMPGLKLTIAQAARLWAMDTHTCEAVLAELVKNQVLFQTPNGSYVLAPRPTPLKAPDSLLRSA